MNISSQLKQNIINKKQKKKLIIIGALLGFLSGLSIFVFKVMDHAKDPRQLRIARIHQ